MGLDYYGDGEMQKGQAHRSAPPSSSVLSLLLLDVDFPVALVLEFYRFKWISLFFCKSR